MPKPYGPTMLALAYGLSVAGLEAEIRVFLIACAIIGGLLVGNSAELYYRLHLLPHLIITPDIQLVIHPVLSPDEDQIWVFGLRARLDF